MAEKRKWIGMGYNLPVNPSKNRVYVWRKLKECGALYYKQGVAILPYQKDKVAFFLRLAEKIRGMGGEASIIEISFFDPADERELIERFIEQSSVEYREMLSECQKLREELRRSPEQLIDRMKQEDLLRKMVNKYSRIRARDHFRLSISAEVRYGMEDIAEILRMSAGDLFVQFKRMLDKL